MSQFQVLPEYDAQQFDKPPKFNNQERISFFTMDKILDHVFVRNSNPDARVGAVLQLRYFKATNKFYSIDSYNNSYSQSVKYFTHFFIFGCTSLILEQNITINSQ